MLSVMCSQHIGSLYYQNSKQKGLFYILNMSVNGASTNFGLLNNVIGM
jgi:hypothetical protein